MHTVRPQYLAVIVCYIVNYLYWINVTRFYYRTSTLDFLAFCGTQFLATMTDEYFIISAHSLL
jgi:hypothetical protein